MHVAAAVGLPVIAVFGPTDPEGTAPVTPPPHHRPAKALLPARAFFAVAPLIIRCMTAVTPSMVESALALAPFPR